MECGAVGYKIAAVVGIAAAAAAAANLAALGTGAGTVFVAGMSAGHLTVLVGWNVGLSSSACRPGIWVGEVIVGMGNGTGGVWEGGGTISPST